MCEYFYNAYIEEGALVNSGFNCRHPGQKETHTEHGKTIGCCYLCSCPLKAQNSGMQSYKGMDYIMQYNNEMEANLNGK